MKGFIKLWLHNASRIVLVVLAIIVIFVIVIFVVIWWLDGYGTLGYIGIGIWSLFCIISLLTLIEYKKK